VLSLVDEQAANATHTANDAKTAGRKFPILAFPSAMIYQKSRCGIFLADP